MNSDLLNRIKKLEVANKPIADLIEKGTVYFKDGTKRTLFYYEAIDYLDDEECANIEKVEPIGGLVWALLS